MEPIGETLLNFITHHPQRDREKKNISVARDDLLMSPLFLHRVLRNNELNKSLISPAVIIPDTLKQTLHFTAAVFHSPSHFFFFFYHVECFVECFLMRSFLKHGRNCLVFVPPCRTEDEAVLFYFLITPPDLLSDGGSGGSPTSGVA